VLVWDWGQGQVFRLADAQVSVCVFGATGSGRTSGTAICHDDASNE
jgi:hypothetical protein